jgi:hypothetical protein
MPEVVELPHDHIERGLDVRARRKHRSLNPLEQLFFNLLIAELEVRTSDADLLQRELRRVCEGVERCGLHNGARRRIDIAEEPEAGEQIREEFAVGIAQCLRELIARQIELHVTLDLRPAVMQSKEREQGIEPIAPVRGDFVVERLHRSLAIKAAGTVNPAKHNGQAIEGAHGKRCHRVTLALLSAARISPCAASAAAASLPGDDVL